MRKRKIILTFMVILFFLCFLGTVYYFFAQDGGTEETETTETGLQPEQRARLESEYEELNEILTEKVSMSWVGERPDDFGLPYALKRAEGEVGYLSLDLDEDTVEELLVGEMNDIGFVIYGIYTGSREGERTEVWVSPGFSGLMLSESGVLLYESDARILLAGLEEDLQEEWTGFYLSGGELETCTVPVPFGLMELPGFVSVSPETEEETVLDADDAVSR